MRTLTWTLAGAAWLLTACAPRALSPLPSATPQAHRAASAQTADAGAATGTARMQPYAEDQPVQVTSDHLTYTQAGQVSVFTGHVQVHQGTTVIASPLLEVRSQDGRAVARQGARLTDPARGLTVTAQEMEYRNTLLNAVARGDVHLNTRDDRGQPLRLLCTQLDWDNRAQTALAQGRVWATYDSATATAETMQYRRQAQVLVLTGIAGKTQPRVEQSGSTITGNAITLHLTDRVYEVMGDARAVVDPQALEHHPAAGKKETP